MRLIAFASHKGGVGKTTASVALAENAARAGRRVLFIDFDPQATGASWLTAPSSEALCDSLLRGSGLPEPEPSSVKGLRVLSGGLNLYRVEQAISADSLDPSALATALAPLRDEFDLGIIDTNPGALGLLSAALRAAEHLVAVTDPSLPGAEGAAAVIDLATAFECAPLGVVVCRYAQGTVFHREALGAIRQRFGALMLDPPIRQSIRLAEAPTYRNPPQTHAHGEPVALDLQSVAAALALRLVPST
jgi:chromosome partitioning protein